MLTFPLNSLFKTAHLKAPAALTPFPGAGPEPEMLTCPFNSLFKTAHFQLRLLTLPFPGAGPEQPLKAAWSRQEPPGA